MDSSAPLFALDDLIDGNLLIAGHAGSGRGSLLSTILFQSLSSDADVRAIDVTVGDADFSFAAGHVAHTVSAAIVIVAEVTAMIGERQQVNALSKSCVYWPKLFLFVDNLSLTAIPRLWARALTADDSTRFQLRQGIITVATLGPDVEIFLIATVPDLADIRTDDQLACLLDGGATLILEAPGSNVGGSTVDVRGTGMFSVPGEMPRLVRTTVKPRR